MTSTYHDRSSSQCGVTLTCHNYLFPPPMPRSETPVDVLLNILDYVDKSGLAAMCRVNKICCSYSQDVLYRDIYARDSRVHQTLAQSTHLARRVRSFSSRSTGSDLAIALRNMTSLRILKLSCDPNMDVFDGCTFKLDSFKCVFSHYYGGSLQKFLCSQPSLKNMTLPLDVGRPSPFEATCLPNLTRIMGAFSWLPYIIPGRPLNEVISHGYTTEHSIDLSFFALSTAPIQKLTIDYSYLYSTPAHLLASFLPSLTHFTLTAFDLRTSIRVEGVVRGLFLY